MRFRRAAAVLAGLALALTACSGEDEPLETAQLGDALLTVDNLGSGWIQKDLDDGDGEQDDESGAGENSPAGTGCLADAELDSIEPIESADAQFTWTRTDVRDQLTLGHGVASYDDVEELTKRLESAYEQMADCTEISNEVQGATLEAEIASDNEPSTDDVDTQLNIHATGSYGFEEQTTEFSILITLAQVGPNLTTLQTVGGADASAAHASYVEIAVDRMVAIGAGDEPAETVAPAPDVG